MRFRNRNKQDEPELNLVPLIDVMLMTLIFLVVTTSFSKESQLRITLPQASSSVKVTKQMLRISIDASGQYFINDKQLLKPTPEALRHEMQRIAGGRRKRLVVVVHADAKTPHQAVVYVMDAARRLGFRNLTFATQQLAKPPK